MWNSLLSPVFMRSNVTDPDFKTFRAEPHACGGAGSCCWNSRGVETAHMHISWGSKCYLTSSIICFSEILKSDSDGNAASNINISLEPLPILKYWIFKRSCWHNPNMLSKNDKINYRESQLFTFFSTTNQFYLFIIS